MQKSYISAKDLFVNSSPYQTLFNKGECSIIDNNWKCKLERLKYTSLIHVQFKDQDFTADSNVSFNIKENKLIIPSDYYDLIVRGYNLVREKKSAFRRRKYHKSCWTFDGII